MKVVDTHQHLWDPAQFSYAWLDAAKPASSAAAAGNPVLNRSNLMDDYLEAAAGIPIEQTVFLEADVDEAFMLAETRWAFALAEMPGNPIAGVVAAARPEDPGFRDYLDHIAGQPALKGIRRVLHVVPDDVAARPLFAENVGSLAGYELSFDLCLLARQLPLGIHLAEQCPEVTFILDHCGNPRIKERIFDSWRVDIRELAAHQNMNCKISGLINNADREHWSAVDLRPYVQHVLECFGWDRVVFGSDWPVCTLAGRLQQWFEAVDLLTQSASEAQRAKLFSANARRIYRLP